MRAFANIYLPSGSRAGFDGENRGVYCGGGGVGKVHVQLVSFGGSQAGEGSGQCFTEGQERAFHVSAVTFRTLERRSWHRLHRRGLGKVGQTQLYL